jgi:hypothetical protein
MKPAVLLINFIMIIACSACHKTKFNAKMYTSQLEIYNSEIFMPIALAMQRNSQMNPEKVKPYLNLANQIDSLGNEFFNDHFLKGDFEYAIKQYKIFKTRSVEMFSGKNLFLSSERNYFIGQIEDSVPIDNFDKLFTNFIRIKCLAHTRFLNAIQSSECFGRYALVYDTINTNNKGRLLHFTDRFSFAKEHTKANIKEFSRNGKSLMTKANLEKIDYFSLFVPCDDDTGAIILKADLQKSVEMISLSKLNLNLKFTNHPN